MKLRFIEASTEYLEEAVHLAATTYAEERRALPILPGDQDFLSGFRKSLEELLNEGSGVMALSTQGLAGFLSGFPVAALFGSARGLFVPLWGHGAVQENRRQVYQGLYREAAALWVAGEGLSHAVSLYAHDRETLDTWFWLGFGLRCVDALREARPLAAPYPREIALKKVHLEDLPALAGIHGEHDGYYRKSPIFMPRQPKDLLQDFQEWLDQENHHAWAAYREETPVGYMRIQPTAESFVSEHAQVMNITGAYVVEGERRAGIGALLLNEIQRWLAGQGYGLCGVDYEALNSLGSGFWGRYFEPYCFSVVRRIDERVLPYGK
jgi:GNAT superfamily N-acetyltransferase